MSPILSVKGGVQVKEDNLKKLPHPHAGRIFAVHATFLLVFSILTKSSLGLVPFTLNTTWFQVILSPNGIFLARSVTNDPFWLYFVVSLVRLLITDPSNYMVGKYGRQLVQQPGKPKKETRSRVVKGVRRIRGLITRVISHLKRPAKAFVRLVEKIFPRWGYWIIFLRGSGWIMVIAGAENFRFRKVMLINIAGTITWLLLVWMFDIPKWLLALVSIF